MHYQYDANGIKGLIYTNASGSIQHYWFGKNAQGDVIDIYNGSGGHVARYNYDAWGNCTIASDSTGSGIATINPIRYRSYYYDTETSWYYLRARYYDPGVGRFLNMDSMLGANGDLLSYNLYAYCSNNPVNYADPSGESIIAAFLIGLAIGWGISSIANALLGEHLASGIFSTLGGAQAIGTGISLLSFGPVGWVLGGAAIIGGTASIAFGAAEIGEHFSGYNYIRDGLGMSQGLYNGLYFGSSILSAGGSIAGSIYMSSSFGRQAYQIQQNSKYWSKGTFKSSYGSLKYHYGKHGNGLSVSGYTNAARGFAARNSSLFQYTYNYKYNNASWNFAYLNGSGGYFTNTGMIITFWLN